MISSQVLIPSGHSKPIGRYSPGIRIPLTDGRSMVFISGQVASDSKGGLLGGHDPSAQAEIVFKRIQAILWECDGDLQNLVSLTIFLADLRHFTMISEVRNRMLSDPPPASTLVEVSRLAEDGRLVEINGIAIVPDRDEP